MAIKIKKTENQEQSPFLQEEPASEAATEVQGGLEKTEEVQKDDAFPKKKKSYWEFGLLLAVGLVIVAAIGALVFWSIKNTKRADGDKVSIQNISEEITKEDAGSEPVKTAEPEKVPEKNGTEVSKSANYFDTAIKILNGGAAGGSAGKVKELLASKGYKKLEAGNSNNTYSGTVIFYQTESKAAAEKILADIKSKYPSAQIKIASSSEEKSGAIVIILGK